MRGNSAAYNPSWHANLVRECLEAIGNAWRGARRPPLSLGRGREGAPPRLRRGGPVAPANAARVSAAPAAGTAIDRPPNTGHDAPSEPPTGVGICTTVRLFVQEMPNDRNCPVISMIFGSCPGSHSWSAPSKAGAPCPQTPTLSSTGSSTSTPPTSGRRRSPGA